MTVLITGVAGFIGYHVAEALLARGERVIGIDNMNDYYDVRLKESRLEKLKPNSNFSFQRLDICDREGVLGLAKKESDITGIIHLAGYAGVRHSLSDPYIYIEANIMGHLIMLEAARLLPNLKHFVYASSSSVYGGNTKFPSSIEDNVDRPVSLYAATKKADELISYNYAHIHRLPQTGLRFFTVYGPWYRPDMAAFIFTRAIINGESLNLFNNGNMQRDFTYIDDIVAGVIRALDRPPADSPTEPPHRVYNLGNDKSEQLRHFVAVLEDAIGKKAIINMMPMQAGDMEKTVADIDATRRDLGYEPTTPIEVGLPRFVDWYRQYYN